MKDKTSTSDVRNTLVRIGAIRVEDLELFSTSTRDNPNLRVFRDTKSGVIFIEDFYGGDLQYVRPPPPSHANFSHNSNETSHLRAEDLIDSERRLKSFMSIITGKRVCDFGCGDGLFLKLAKHITRNVCGVELNTDKRFKLVNSGIECYPDIRNVPYDFDVVTMFHVLEHLPTPSYTLREIRNRFQLSSGGILIVEVPHARDFLISRAALPAFIAFTLWSQHLILHTRESLRLLLEDAGFRCRSVIGVQRYGLSNHLNWLLNKVPGGHTSALSVMDTPDLHASYSQALQQIDATDTLVAIAEF
jgi:SAM-dependent methyltransferase